MSERHEATTARVPITNDEELAVRTAYILGPSSAAAACLRQAANLRAHGAMVRVVLQGNVWTLFTGEPAIPPSP